MSWNLFSLVLACATGWSLAFLGYLPVVQLRRLRAEPLKAAGSWAVVAATAPSSIFHWHLIFALVCLIAWTKLDRPAGKVYLAAAGSLGLSLGIIFALEMSLPLRGLDPFHMALPLSGLKNPLALILLYLSGATIGQAYILAVVAKLGQTASTRWGASLIIMATAWVTVVVISIRRFYLFPPKIAPPVPPALSVVLSATWMPLAATAVVWVLAFCVFIARHQKNLRLTRGLAVATALMAGVASLVDLSSLLAAETGPLIQF